jgi:hypothetical protein
LRDWSDSLGPDGRAVAAGRLAKSVTASQVALMSE